MIYSAYSAVSAYTTIFLVWIVIGFVLSEVKGIVTKAPYELDISKEGQIVAQNLGNLSVNDKTVNTIEAVYSLDDTVRVVIDGLMSKHTPSAVIVDNGKHPVGIANVVDLLLLPAGTVGIMTMRHVHLEKVISVEENSDSSIFEWCYIPYRYCDIFQYISFDHDDSY